MSTRALFFIFSILAVISVATATIVGGYEPIKDLQDSHIQEIAKFAVAEHNKQTGASLVYLRIINGESQIAEGTNYRLAITASNGGHTLTYVAIVDENLSKQSKTLVSFYPVN